MLIEIMLICSLINTAPYYDCNQEWVIKLYDTKYINDECDSSKKTNVLGCAKYMSHPHFDFLNKPVIMLGNDMGYRDKWGMNTLEHEIRHIKCRCSWQGHP